MKLFLALSLTALTAFAADPQYIDTTAGAGDSGRAGGVKINNNLSNLVSGYMTLTNPPIKGGLSVDGTITTSNLSATAITGSPVLSDLSNAGHGHTNAATGQVLPNYASVVLWRNGLPHGFAHVTNAQAVLQSGDALQLRTGDHWVNAGAATAAPIYLNNKSNITIYGDGCGTRLMYTNEGDVMYIDTCTNITVRDLAVVSPIELHMTNHNYLWSAIHIADKTSFCLFDHLLFENAPDHCISRPTGEKFCSFNTVQNCRFVNCGDDFYGDERLSAYMILTGNPTTGDKFTFTLTGNGGTNMLSYTRYWTNAASGYNGTVGWVLAGADKEASTTNLYTYLATNKSALFNAAYGNASSILFSLPSTTHPEKMTNDVTGSYAVDAYSLAGSDGTAVSGIGEGWVVKNSYFINNLRDIEFENVNQPTSLIKDNIFEGNYHYGTKSYCYWSFSATDVLAADVQNNIGNNLILNNTMRHISNSAVRLDSGFNISIRGNTIEGVTNPTAGLGYAIVCLAASSKMNTVDISDNTLTGIKMGGITVIGQTYPVTNVTINNNRIQSYNGGVAGIDVAASGVLISGNHIRVQAGGSGYGGIALTDGTQTGFTNHAHNVIVYGNHITDIATSTSRRGIYVMNEATSVDIGLNHYKGFYQTNQILIQHNSADTDDRSIRVTAPIYGTGSPEATVALPAGSIWIQTDGGDTNVWFKGTTTNYIDYWNWRNP